MEKSVVSRAACPAAVWAEEKQTQDYKLEKASPSGAMRLGASAVWTDPIPSQLNGLHSFAQQHVSSPRAAWAWLRRQAKDYPQVVR